MEIKVLLGTWFTPQEVADALKVSEKTVYNWCSEGTLESCKFGNSVRVSAKHLTDFIEKSDRFAMPSSVSF